MPFTRTKPPIPSCVGRGAVKSAPVGPIVREAVFAGIDLTDVDFYPDDASMQKFAALQKQKKQS
jgi:hypothetical protein